MPGWGLETLEDVLSRKRVLVPLQGRAIEKDGNEEKTKVLVYVKGVGGVETCMPQHLLPRDLNPTLS